MGNTTTVVALIPARSGSRRVPNKNVALLNGHPLLAYTIRAAKESGIFADIIVATDTKHYAEIAERYGARVPFLRPTEISGDISPDIEWVEYTLRYLKNSGRAYDCFSILRPTSPFRTADTIRRAWQRFLEQKNIDSLRAVEKCKQHPGKMWVIRGDRMLPLLPLSPSAQPWHSSQYQSLPEVYVQNASLEIAWTHVVLKNRTIAGNIVVPFFTEGHEGFDINDPHDWRIAEELIRTGKTSLPSLPVEEKNKEPIK